MEIESTGSEEPPAPDPQDLLESTLMLVKQEAEEEEQEDNQDCCSFEEDIISKGVSTRSKRNVVKGRVPGHRVKLEHKHSAKRASLSIKDKIGIIEAIKNGEKQSRVAARLKLAHGTINGIWTRRSKYETMALQGNLNQKKCRKQQFPEMTTRLLSWMEERKTMGNPPTGVMIREQARIVAKELGKVDFLASSGWLEKFVKRNKVILPYSKKTTESPSNDLPVMEVGIISQGDSNSGVNGDASVVLNVEEAEEDRVSVKEEVISSSSDEEYEPPSKKKRKKKPIAKKKSKPLTTSVQEVIKPSVNLKIFPMPRPKRMSLSIKEKMEIIKALKDGERQSTVSLRFKLGHQTVNNIWAHREDIEKQASEGHWNRKKCRGQQVPELDGLLVSWIEYMKKLGTPANGTQIKEQAKILTKGFGVEDFSASSGWLEKFKERNKVILPRARKPERKVAEIERREKDREKAVANGGDFGDAECNGADDHHDFHEEDNNEMISEIETTIQEKVAKKNSSSEWLLKVWSQIAKDYEPGRVYFVDAFPLFYREIPETCELMQGMSCSNGELASERLSVMFCVNILGTDKHKLIVCGGINSPPSFGTGWTVEENERLPTEYLYNSKAVFTPDLISSRLCNWNLKLEKGLEKRNVLLLLKDSPVNRQVRTSCAQLSCIKIELMDSNVKSLEIGIGTELKVRYKKLLLQKLAREKEKETKNCSNNTQIGVLAAISILHVAWMGMESNEVERAFQKAGLLNQTAREETLSAKPKSKISVKLLVDEAQAAGVIFPRGISFKSWTNLEENLSAFGLTPELPDQRNEIPFYNKQYSKPAINTLLNELDNLRYWAVKNPHVSELSTLHNAISTIQNFCTDHLVLSSSALLPQTTILPEPQQPQTSQLYAYQGPATSSSMFSTVDFPSVQIFNGQQKHFLQTHVTHKFQ